MKRVGHVSLELEQSTLGELRAALAETTDLGDDTVVRVRTRFAFNALGAEVATLNLVRERKP